MGRGPPPCQARNGWHDGNAQTDPTTIDEAPDRARRHAMAGITPFLWFDTQAEDAANFYVSVFPRSKIVNVSS